MKTNTHTTIVICSLLLGAFLFPKQALAQACSTYYPMKEGVRMEYTMYGKKGKVEGTQWQEVTDLTQSTDGMEATMNMGFQDGKGKEAYNMSYGFKCNGSTVTIDYESLMSGAMLQQPEDMEMEITGTDIEFPNDLEVGMELADANVQMKMSMGAMNMNMKVDITNRKVEKEETITTPAGTFDCKVIYSETTSKMMMANQTFPNRTWLAEGVGMVKNESYNKKGKVTGTMVLSSISQ